MTDPKHHDPLAGGIYRAIALRFYCRYVSMRNSAEFYGADFPGHGKPMTERSATDEYLAAVEEWLWESPDSATAALAFAEFAGVITADRVVGEALLRDQVVSEERDAFYQTVVMATVAQ